MGIDCSLNPIPKFASVHLIPIHGTRGAPTRNSGTTIRQLPSAPCFERTDTSGDESVVCQRALIRDSMNDKQRSYDLSGPLSH